MHDILKRRRYTGWLFLVGGFLVFISLFGYYGKNDQEPSNQKSNKNTKGKRELTVSRQMIQVMVDSALKENPALRETLPTLEKEYEQTAIAQEMIVAEAIEQGIANKDPIVRNRLSELFILSIYQQADVQVTPEAVRKYYEEHKEKYTMPERRLIQHLFVRVTNVMDEDKAKITLERLFKQSQLSPSRMPEAVAKAITPIWISRQELRLQFGPLFADKVFWMPIGEWSKPFQSTSGWHRVKVLEHQPEHIRPFEEVSAEVENDLRSKLRLDYYYRELDRLKTKYDVKITE